MARLVEAVLRGLGRRELLLEPLLEITDSVMTYRRRYFAEARIGGVLDLLLLDPTNPRAVAFQLAVLEHHAAGLPAGPNPEGVAEFQQRLAALPAQLDAVRSMALDAGANMAGTIEWLAGFAVELGSLSELLTHVYFSHVVPRIS